MGGGGGFGNLVVKNRCFQAGSSVVPETPGSSNGLGTVAGGDSPLIRRALNSRQSVSLPEAGSFHWSSPFAGPSSGLHGLFLSEIANALVTSKEELSHLLGFALEITIKVPMFCLGMEFCSLWFGSCSYSLGLPRRERLICSTFLGMSSAGHVSYGWSDELKHAVVHQQFSFRHCPIINGSGPRESNHVSIDISEAAFLSDQHFKQDSFGRITKIPTFQQRCCMRSSISA